MVTGLKAFVSLWTHRLEEMEEELKAMELDMTGKIMLASWRGTRFEVVQVLREVSLRIFVTYFMS